MEGGHQVRPHGLPEVPLGVHGHLDDVRGVVERLEEGEDAVLWAALLV